MKKNIVLVGLMGAGKSTIGRQLARRMRLEFYDSDHVIEERMGVPISTIFAVEGEDGFRERETAIIEELSQKQGIVLATGGGSVLREENRKLIRRAGTVIYLCATAEQLYERIGHDKKRPLMQTENPLQTLRDLLKQRETHYQEVADLIVYSGKQRVSSLVRDVHNKIKSIQGGRRANAKS